ncbi:DUF5682 family protein [Thermocatellispora tengchongensis]|uniref:DUF5682 family protein n=1 Tax=Thermocatellispora tengchongensis TaxID=1073253 RepID=UPI0036359522
MTPPGSLASASPPEAVAALAGSARPYLLGVRHHSPALAVVLPELLDAAGAEVVCVELPADFQPWLEHLADPATVAPVALAGTGADGRLGFYPFADFSPSWSPSAGPGSRARRCAAATCRCPTRAGRPRTTSHRPARRRTRRPGRRRKGRPGRRRKGGPPRPARRTPTGWPPPAPAVTVMTCGTARWRSLAPGCEPEAVRRAALGVGWALRRDAETAGGVPARDLAREAHMRRVIAAAGSGGRRVAAVVGAFHAPALAEPGDPGGSPGRPRRR